MIGRPSPNFEPRPPGIRVDMLVLHYTGMASAEAALERLCDPRSKASAHYVVGEDGAVWRLVEEGCRAWHAGEAWWRGGADVNGRSVGVEIVNPGHEFGLRPYPEPQMAALIALARDILARHRIAARNVVGHSDVAPRRKRDPGELFDWRRLADEGIGLWPSPGPAEAASAEAARRLLAEIGYETVDLGATVRAFQRRFRPRRIDGIVDDETAALIAAYARGCRAGA